MPDNLLLLAFGAALAGFVQGISGFAFSMVAMSASSTEPDLHLAMKAASSGLFWAACVASGCSAATAQKVALNMLSVLVGIRLGHVHDGYMVNVVADNAKLVDRAARIVAALSGAGMDTAKAALGETGGAVKPAVLIAAGTTAEAAKAALGRSGGHIGPVVSKVHYDKIQRLIEAVILFFAMADRDTRFRGHPIKQLR